MNSYVSAWSLACLVGCSVPTLDPASVVSIDEGRCVRRVTIGESPFAEYDFVNHRFPIVYPIYGPTGAAMTRHFPMRRDVEGEAHDHPHHRSLWFAHGSVNGHDFWHGKNCKVIHREFFVEDALDASRSIETRNDWMVGDTRICSDERRLVFGGDAMSRTIDYTITIHASDGDVVFGDTKEGTMAMRVAAPLRLKGEVANGAIRNSEGEVGKRCWGKRARWIAYDGTIQGQRVGVALMDHPGNLRHPTWWHARDYGLAAANPFGVHDFEQKPKGTGDFTVKAGESATWRYRFWFFVGGVEEASVEECFGRFAGE